MLRITAADWRVHQTDRRCEKRQPQNNVWPMVSNSVCSTVSKQKVANKRSDFGDVNRKCTARQSAHKVQRLPDADAEATSEWMHIAKRQKRVPRVDDDDEDSQ